MQLFMRLLYPADIDLILIRLSMGRRFPTFIKQCIRSKIYGRKFEYIPPASSSFDLSELNAEYCINLWLDEEYDSDIISYITCFPKRSRSPVIVRIMLGCSTRFPDELFSKYVQLQTDQQASEGIAEEWNEDLMIFDETGELGPESVKNTPAKKTGTSAKSGTHAKKKNTDSDSSGKTTANGGTGRKTAETSAEETKPETQPEQPETSSPSDFDFDETLLAFSRLSMGSEHSLASAAGNITGTPKPLHERQTEPANEHNTHELQNEYKEKQEIKHVSHTESDSITDGHKEQAAAVQNGFDSSEETPKHDAETEASEQPELSEPSDFDFDETLLAFARLSTGSAHSLASSVSNITPTSEPAYERATEQLSKNSTKERQKESEEKQDDEHESQQSQQTRGLEKKADTANKSKMKAYQEPETAVQNGFDHDDEMTETQQKPKTSKQPESPESSDFDFDETLLAFARLSTGSAHSLASSAGNITPTSEPAYKKPIEPPDTHDTQELQIDQDIELQPVQPTEGHQTEPNAAIKSNTKEQKTPETDTPHGFDDEGFGAITQNSENYEGYASKSSGKSETQTAQTDRKTAGKRQKDDIDEDDMMSMFTQMMNH